MARGFSDQDKRAFAERVVKAAAAKRLDQAELIRRMALSGPKPSDASMSQWFNGFHIPRFNTRKRLADALGATDDYLMGRIPADDPLRPDLVVTTGGARDLPVYGSAEGGNGVMIIDSDPIEYAPRPATLIGVKGAFAIYVVNDSMAPAYEQGDRVHIHPGRPVTPGKDALFIREDADGTRHAMIKRLVRATNTTWKVCQFNPVKTFDLPKGMWQKAQRIVGSDRAD
jgi:SOS-response transcriptional repressor LexA